MIPTIKMKELLSQYEVILLDAYGVLVYSDGPIPGAREIISHLNEIKKTYYILTNDSMRRPEVLAQFYQDMGIPISKENIISPGVVLPHYFEEKKLKGKSCAVLGTDDSRFYVRKAGGEIVTLEENSDAEVFLVCSEVGYPFLETLDTMLTMLFHRLDQGEKVHLLLLDCDLLYVKHEGAYGFSAKSGALLLEAGLRQRYPEKNLCFHALGKPHPYMYEYAASLSQTRNMIMIGDQLITDIAGARNFGIDSALVTTGITQWEKELPLSPILPTYLLHSLKL